MIQFYKTIDQILIKEVDEVDKKSIKVVVMTNNLN